jgi:hypothetical protein
MLKHTPQQIRANRMPLTSSYFNFGLLGRLVLGQIPVVFHIIHSSTGKGKVTSAMIAKQLQVMNRAFAGEECDSVGRDCEGNIDSKIRFTLFKMIYYESPLWSTSGALKTYKESIAASLTKQFSSVQYMNIVSGDAGSTLGWTQYPWSDKEGDSRQGQLTICCVHSCIGVHRCMPFCQSRSRESLVSFSYIF